MSICSSSALVFSAAQRITASHGAVRVRARSKTCLISASVNPRLFAFQDEEDPVHVGLGIQAVVGLRPPGRADQPQLLPVAERLRRDPRPPSPTA